MTTAGMWWADTLESFSEAFGVRYDLVQENHSAVRDTGEWWQRSGSWCVQVDAYCHAVWLDGMDNPAWRRALSVSLQNASAGHARQLSWQQVVTRHFSELVHRALTDNWAPVQGQRKLGLRLTTREIVTPGYFAWLEFSRQPTDADEFRMLVQQVVEAFAEVVFVGWTDHPGNVQAALVFLQQPHTASDGFDLDYGLAEVEDNEDGIDAKSRGVAARALQPLLGSLESDAMVPVKATIGAEVTDIHEWASGLYTLAEAWRERAWFAPGQSTYAWGQQPLAYLLSSLTHEQMEPFLHMLQPDATRDILLSSDLAETLQGVLAANLNISEASRLLYLHRNTLTNRIDRIHSQTGYDIRQFEDALILWIAQVLLRRERGAGKNT